MIAGRVVDFIELLRIPEGPLAGQRVALAPFQREFIEGSLAASVSIGALSVARGNGKSALSAGISLAALVGELDPQPRRFIPFAARTRDQAAVAFSFVEGFARTLPDDIQRRFTIRRSPRLEIEYADDAGPHILRAVAADGKTALGSGPTFCLMDERAAWPDDQGDALEAALLSGLGKRGGRALIISTSAATDAASFSRWLDEDTPGTYRQEHRPSPGLPADDLESLLIANPGAAFGIGANPDWLRSQARMAIRRGGSALTSFRLLNRNERVSDESRAVLLTADQWLNCETDALALPPREGPVVIGIDLGGSASMSAASYYWPQTGRLEAHGTFPSQPNLLNRGQADHVGSRYVEMANRGELSTLGEKTVPIAAWLRRCVSHVEDQPIAAIVADRFKQSEVGEALDSAHIKAPPTWRGQGFRDGGEDVERFRRACFDQQVKSAPSLLLRSAFADAVCVLDPAGNSKIAKGRSDGRIDAASAAVLAVAEGMRRVAKPERKARVLWA